MIFVAMEYLPPSFYTRPTPTVARELLGCIMRHTQADGSVRTVRLVETEAYLAENDLACHAATKRTVRNDVMFSVGGVLYVYLIYGMYFCANVVTENEGRGCAVLLRAGEIIDDPDAASMDAAGPGKLARYMGWTRADNGRPLGSDGLEIYRDAHTPEYRERTVVTTRIGITKDADLPLRYYVEGAPEAKKPPKTPFKK